MLPQAIYNPLRDLARCALALLNRAKSLPIWHEDLANIVFWAALIGICGALSSVAFREATRLLERLLTGQSQSLVQAASGLVWWHRAVDYMEAVLVGDGRIGFRASIGNALSSLLTISSGGSIGREGAMVQLAAMIGSRLRLAGGGAR